MNPSAPFNERGLSAQEALSRLKQFGPNSLPENRNAGVIRQLLGLMREPMLLLLVLCATVYLIIGDLAEGLLLLGSVFLILGISFFQSRKTENALRALHQMTSPRALVIRDGAETRISGTEVVPGDILVLREGDRVAADAKVLSSTALMADESMLTGEAFSVQKGVSQSVYSGTLLTKGRGVALVEGTGVNTQIGRLGKGLHGPDTRVTRLQFEIRQLVRVFATAGMLFCLALFLTYGILKKDWINAALAGLATAMSLVPEEFPVVLTVFLALGAWRMSRDRVLTRRMDAIENLGAISVLCVDKTGTLTENRMSVAEISAPVSGRPQSWKASSSGSLHDEYHRLLEYGVLASQPNPFDPMEKAILALFHERLSGSKRAQAKQMLVREYPLSERLMAMACVWSSENAASDRLQDLVVAAKGAPEAIWGLCSLVENERKLWSQAVQKMANEGMRILGVASARLKAVLPEDLPAQLTDFEFAFEGLIGLEDPVRADTPAAVAACRQAGIRVIMMTGDYAGTAAHVAEKVGISGEGGVLTGADVERLSDLELQEKVRTTQVFARMLPDQKLRVVDALQKNGQHVAMTGDGVNDAPSLRRADVGIAMGARGTDVARESAHLVLLDDRFSSIVAGIRQGRRIFDNIEKAMAYIFAIHVPIAGLAFLPVVLGWPLVLLPAHVVFLELIIDPTSSLVFESQPEDPSTMRRPPRPTEHRFFSWSSALWSSMQGLVVLAFALGLRPYVDRAGLFVYLVLANLGLVISVSVHRAHGLSWLREAFRIATQRRALWVAGLAILALTAVLSIEPIRVLFRFAPISSNELAIAAGVACMAVLTALKLQFFVSAHWASPKAAPEAGSRV